MILNLDVTSSIREIKHNSHSIVLNLRWRRYQPKSAARPCLLRNGKNRREILLGLTLVALVVVRHLKTSSSEAALDVEALVRLAAVEDRLVAADLLGDEVERLDDPQAELLALLVLGDRDVFDVADEAEGVDAAKKGRVSNGFELQLLLSTPNCASLGVPRTRLRI
jgi:hypothetical protein